MKESEDNDFEELLFIENEETEKQNINKEFHLKIFNYNEKKPDNYILLNQDEDLLLCKEEAIKEIKSKKENNEEIKIKELFKGEDNDSFFYINKKETKKHFLKNIIELDKENENSKVDILDNKNKEEMEKIYKEIQLKHPRKIIDGKIRRYSFFSWSGFFCCNKPEYLSLGQGYISYFNTIKFFIVLFFIISIINIKTIYEFSQYRTIYTSFENNTLLKTTLGNTITSYFNTSFVHAVNSSVQVNFNCEKNIFNGIDGIRYSENHPDDEDIRSINGKNETDFSHYNDLFKDSQLILQLSLSDFYEREYWRKNNFTVKLNDIIGENELNRHQNKSFIIYFSCKFKYRFANYFDLEIFFLLISSITLIVIIMFYFLYKKAISSDKKVYQKNKIFITNYTLVLKNLKINSIDYDQEINDLISFLNDKINQYRHLMAPIEGNNNDINSLNIFDISISNVNSDKIEIFKSIKSLKNKIEDIQNDNDTIKNKLKNNVKEISHSIKNVFKNLSSKEIKDEDNNNENDPVMSRDSISLSKRKNKCRKIKKN